MISFLSLLAVLWNSSFKKMHSNLELCIQIWKTLHPNLEFCNQIGESQGENGVDIIKEEKVKFGASLEVEEKERVKYDPSVLCSRARKLMVGRNVFG